jgi:tetratricopeptide (TPR) repeat protein
LILKKENTAEAALILENIAKGYYEEENYDSAIENHQKSLMIWQKLKGKESIEVAKVHFRIGNIQKDQKKYSKAI